MRTGILGGTFDPIHIGHLHAGETALHQANLDRVLFLPAGDPWQKRYEPISEPGHRLTMTRLSVEGVDGLEADDREIVRGGPTYSIDTLESFPADEELFLILGADAASRIGTWHRVDDVLRRARVLIVPRNGFDSGEVAEAIPHGVVLDMGLIDVSGTGIRVRASAGEPFRFLVRESVYDYIVKNGLYRQGPEADMVEEIIDLEESS